MGLITARKFMIASAFFFLVTGCHQQTVSVDLVFRQTPKVAELVKAAASGNETKLKDLLANSANPNALGQDDVTPLIWTMLDENAAAFELLLRHGADPNLLRTDRRSTMDLVVLMEDQVFLDLALKYGGDINLVNSWNGRTPIYQVLDEKWTDRLLHLIAMGADQDFQNEFGDTPIAVAAFHQQWKTVFVLLESGADYTLADMTGRTMITSLETRYYSRLHDLRGWRKKVVEYLRSAGVTVDPS